MKKSNLIASILVLCSLSAGAVVTNSSATTPSVLFGTAATCSGLNGAGGLTDTITFVESANLTDADVSVEFTHSFRSDLQFHVNYDGTDVLLAADHGSLDNNYFATFNSQSAVDCITECANGSGMCDTFGSASNCSPDGNLDDFNGKLSDIAGGWTLFFCDDAGGDEGTLDAWSITLDGPPPLPVELLNFEIE